MTQPRPLPRIDQNDRATCIATVRRLSPDLDDSDIAVSEIRGTQAQGQARLQAIQPAAYVQNRNHLDGDVTGLSPYIRHGMISLTDVRNRALDIAPDAKLEKFLQQLAWRDYWQRLYRQHPDWIWTDVEPYKTGFSADDYADTLPDDIAEARTGVAAIDHFLRELIQTGWLHNHARLYVAGYICHWRRVKWQAGAQFFLTHLLDGDPASNNLSWQWVASTFSHKPHYFNLENVARFSGPNLNCNPSDNQALAGSYEDLALTLFPHLEAKP